MQCNLYLSKVLAKPHKISVTLDGDGLSNFIEFIELDIKVKIISCGSKAKDNNISLDVKDADWDLLSSYVNEYNKDMVDDYILEVRESKRKINLNSFNFTSFDMVWNTFLPCKFKIYPRKTKRRNLRVVDNLRKLEKFAKHPLLNERVKKHRMNYFVYNNK